MSDWLHKVLQWADYNRYKVLACVLATGLVGWLHGCEPTSTSLLNPAEKVNYDQFQQETITGAQLLNQKIADYEAAGVKLQQEADAFQQKTTLTEADFAKQFESRKSIVETSAGLIGALASGNPVNIAETVSSLAAIYLTFMGVGAIGDKRRADVKILEMKNGGDKT